MWTVVGLQSAFALLMLLSQWLAVGPRPKYSPRVQSEKQFQGKRASMKSRLAHLAFSLGYISTMTAPNPWKPRCEQWIVAPRWPRTGHLFAMGSWGTGKRNFMSGALRVSFGGVWVCGWCLPDVTFLDQSSTSCHAQRLQEMPWTLLMLLSFAALALGNGEDTSTPQEENWTQSATNNEELLTFRLWRGDIQDFENQG